MPLVFEWDQRRERANLRKHGVSFTGAASVFADELARIFADEIHSADEAREIIIGHSQSSELLLVCFAERVGNGIRIISARRATKREQRDYEDHHN